MQTGLLQRVASADPAAMQECIDRYGGLVWTLSRRACATGAEAEDATQEIFVELWRSAGRFDPTLASETTFIAMIARRRLIDRRRHAARRPTSAPLNDQAAASMASVQSTEHAEQASRAAAALAELKPEQQRLIRLSILHGLSHDRIAEATGLPLGTVKTHIRRGLIQLREVLSGGGTRALEAAP